jgi:hypothetical protein
MVGLVEGDTMTWLRWLMVLTGIVLLVGSFFWFLQTDRFVSPALLGAVGLLLVVFGIGDTDDDLLPR